MRVIKSNYVNIFELGCNHINFDHTLHVSNTVVVHLTTDLEIGGLNPAAARHQENIGGENKVVRQMFCEKLAKAVFVKCPL